MPEKDENLDQEMERDTEIRRETDVRNALGPIEGTDAERNAAESALSSAERGAGDTGVEREAERTGEPASRAHVERGAHSDESMTAAADSDDVSAEEDLYSED